MQALMAGQKLREAAEAEAAVPPPGVEISWSTRKKEGMRLKRLCEENADAENNFPHMVKLWQGSKEDMQGGQLGAWVVEHPFWGKKPFTKI